MYTSGNELASDLTSLRDNLLRDPLHFQVYRPSVADSLLKGSATSYSANANRSQSKRSAEE